MRAAQRGRKGGANGHQLHHPDVPRVPEQRCPQPVPAHAFPRPPHTAGPGRRLQCHLQSLEESCACRGSGELSQLETSVMHACRVSHCVHYQCMHKFCTTVLAGLGCRSGVSRGSQGMRCYSCKADEWSSGVQGCSQIRVKERFEGVPLLVKRPFKRASENTKP